MYIQCLFIKEQYLSQYPHSPLSHLCWASCMWLHKRLCSPPPSSSLHWIESSDQTWWAPSWERARPKPWEEGRHGHQPHPTSPTHQPLRRLPSPPSPAPSDYCWLPPRVGWGEVQETGCQKSTNMFKNIPLEQNWFSLWQDIKSEPSTEAGLNQDMKGNSKILANIMEGPGFGLNSTKLHGNIWPKRSFGTFMNSLPSPNCTVIGGAVSSTDPGLKVSLITCNCTCR